MLSVHSDASLIFTTSSELIESQKYNNFRIVNLFDSELIVVVLGGWSGVGD